MDGKQKEGYTQDQIRDAFCATTDETRDRLKQAATLDTPVAGLVTSHAEAVNKALDFLTTKIYRHNRPRDTSQHQLRRFMRDEVDAVWYIHVIMDDDITLIRGLKSRLEASIPRAFKEELQSRINQVYSSIDAGLNIVRTSLDGWDDYTPDERSKARLQSIDTLATLAGQWSAIAEQLTVIEDEFSEKGRPSGAAATPAPEDDTQPGHPSVAGLGHDDVMPGGPGPGSPMLAL